MCSGIRGYFGPKGYKLMKSNLRAIVKFLYYGLRSALGGIFIPRPYRYEYAFFEYLRRGSYSDLSYQEKKLRSQVHQIDKMLVFDQVADKGALVEQITKLVGAVTKSLGHDQATVRWTRDVLAEYNRRLAGQGPCGNPISVPDHQQQMVLEHLVRTRRSIRSFRPDVISEDILHKILTAGLWAPSGCNRQAIEYLICRSMDDIQFCQRLAGEVHQFPTKAPLAIIVLVDGRNYALPTQRHMAYLEAGAAIQNMLLTAHSYGLGSCWLFWNDAGSCHAGFVERFSIQPYLLPVAMVCLGYPLKYPIFAPVRKALDKSVHNAKPGVPQGRP